MVNSVPRGLPDRQDVHTIHPNARNVVTSGIVGGVGGRSLGARAHTVAVVLANENGRNVQQLGNIVSLKGLTLIGGSVTVEGHADTVGALVFGGQRNAGAQRHLSAHDTVAAVKVLGVHVHRAALASGTTALSTGKFGEYAQRGHSHQVGPAVRSVGGDYGVVGSQSCLDTDRYSFLQIESGIKNIIVN